MGAKHAVVTASRPIRSIAILTLIAALGLLLLGLPRTIAGADTAGPAIATDQADYAPGATVTLTGTGWPAADSVHVTVDDSDGRTWHYTADPTSDDNGGFVTQFVLPDWFVANYTATAADDAGNAATTTFTDSNIQVGAVNPNGRIPVSVLWTTFKKDGACSGTTLNSGSVTTVTTGNGFTGTSGVGNTSSESLLAPASVIIGGELYAFHDWSGAVSSTNTSVCIPGNVQHGSIQQLATYVDAGPAGKLEQSISFPIIGDKTFGDPDFTVTATASSGLPVSFSASGPCTVTGSTVDLTGVGDCTITATQDGNSAYYAATPVARSFTINAGGTVVTVTCPTSVVYNGSAQTPCTAEATGSGGLDVTGLTVTYANNTDVGTATASASYPGDANHAAATGSATFQINPAPSTVAVSCPATATYSGDLLTPCTATVSGVGGLSQTLAITYSNNTNVGTATASASYGGDPDHTGSSGSSTFDITPASSTVTVTCPPSTTYTGAAIEPCTATVSGAGGLTGSLSVSYTDNVNAGTATASASYPGDANHNASNGSATFEISRAGVTVAVTCSGPVTYNGSPQTPCSASVTAPDGLDQVLTVTYTDNVDAGTATASASYPGDANHSSGNDSTTFTIDKAPSAVTVTCSSPAVYNGGAQTPCTANVTGAGGLGQPLTVTYTDNINAGTATASASYPGDANHLADSGSATFTIDKAPSTTTVSCPSDVTYDGTPQTPCTATATGAGGLNASLPVDYPADHTNAGLITVGATYAGDDNHLGSTGTGSFTIDQAPTVTVVTCPASVTYTGGALTPCSASVTGADGLSQTLSVGYTDNVNAGTATATATYAGDANHLSSSDTEHFIINPASSTVTIACANVTYNGQPQTPCSATATGAGGLNQPVAVIYPADHTNAGPVNVSASYAGDPNHTGSSNTASFTIGQAHLTVTADDKSMAYGDPVPPLTYQITGYVNGETFGPTSGVSGTASCSTHATSTSPAGPYPITCTIGSLSASNYDFGFVDGTLTIATKSATLGYTGNLFWSTGSATATTANVMLQGVITPGSGGNPDLTKATVQFQLYKSGNLTMATTDATCAATANAAGQFSCPVTLGVDNWTVIMHLTSTQYFTAPDSDPVVLTVYQPTTDKFATGGGWVTDPSANVSPANKHGNFGFTVRYAKNNTPSGQSVYVFRGSDGYDYVVKSNSWNGGGLSFGTNTVSFSAKANVTVINRATGQVVSGLGGGNYTFRVDATDNGSPGSTDSYAISVYTSTGTLYHQAGTTSAQLTLGGGNIVVHIK